MKTIVFKLLIIILFFSSVISHAAEIYIDCSKMKPFPELFTASIWLNGDQLIRNPADFYILKKFLKENNPAVIQWTLPVGLLRGSKSFEDFKIRFEKHLHQKPVQFLIKEEIKKGFLLIVGFSQWGMMPLWLSSRKDTKPAFEYVNDPIWVFSPPKNYKEWAKIPVYVLETLKKLGVKKMGFFIGHEPDWLWLGKEEDFFKLYAYTVKAIKKIHKNIKVGGIGT